CLSRPSTWSAPSTKPSKKQKKFDVAAHLGDSQVVAVLNVHLHISAQRLAAHPKACFIETFLF
ncbi:MAG: hypothetical protein ABI845_07600, partial [Polaromonas sp.]